MGHAVETAVAAAELIGAAALILDVLPDGDFERRKAFYTRIGFAEIGNGDPGRLFLAMSDARAELLATA
jgi:hypothetical protein